MACKQVQIAQKCSCLYSPYYLTFDDTPFYHGSAPHCQLFDLRNVSRTLQMMECALDVDTDCSQMCFEKCKPNCTALQYTHAHSTTRWPAKSMQLEFYNSHIRIDDDNTSDQNTTSSPLVRGNDETTVEAINTRMTSQQQTKGQKE